MAITNYGRCFVTQENYQNGVGGYTCYSPANDDTIHIVSNGQVKPIIKLDPLSYKIPSQFWNVLLSGLKLGAVDGASLFGYHSNDGVPINSF